MQHFPVGGGGDVVGGNVVGGLPVPHLVFTVAVQLVALNGKS